MKMTNFYRREQKNKAHRSSYKSFFLVLIVMLMSISMVSAFNFDNVKEYDSINKEVTIKNLFGFGKDIATIKLTTPLENQVMRGSNVLVAEIEVNSLDKVDKLFKKMETFNAKDMKKLDRKFNYKIKTIESVEVQDARSVCSDPNNPSTCYGVNDGTHMEERVVWIDFDNTKDLEVREVTIGIFTEVKPNDYVEWIPTFLGNIRVQEWATWSDGFNIGLISWWKLDETTGNEYEDSKVGHHANFVNGADIDHVTAKIDYGTQFDGTSQYILINDSSEWDFSSGAYTFGLWFKGNGTQSAGQVTMFARVTGSGTSWSDIGISMHKTSSHTVQFQQNDNGGAGVTVSGAVNINDNAWHQVIVTKDGSDFTIYVDGNSDGTESSASAIQNSANPLRSGFGYAPTEYLNGTVDELFVYNRSLNSTEITAMYNGGVGLTPVPPSAVIVVTLNTPTNNTNSSETIQYFNGSFTSTIYDLANSTLMLWDSLGTRTTNFSTVKGSSNSSTLALSGLTDGIYLWNYQACASDGTCNNATANLTLNIDTTSPSINITYPLSTIVYHAFGSAVSLNYSIGDNLYLDTCWFEYNNINTTLDCSTNSTFTPVINYQNLTIYANDSAGNANSNFILWEYGMLVNSETWNNITTEGSLETFELNLTTSGSQITVANLIYNGTVNAGALTIDGFNYKITKELTIPAVTTEVKVELYWQLELADASTANSTTRTQNISNIGIDNCAAHTFMVANLTLVDEDTQLQLSPPATENTSIKVDLNIFSIGSTTALINFSEEYNYTNPAQICLSQINSSRYRMDAIFEYSSRDRFTEFYHIQNYTLNNATLGQNISLYDLNSTVGQEFTITYKDSSFNTVPEALVQVQRKYVDEGVFKVVEIAKISNAGYTVVHLIPSDAVYNLIVIKDGVVLDSFNNVVASCQTPALTDCEININSLGSSVSPADFDLVGDFSSTLTYNETTRLLSSTFAITSGSSAITTLNATLYNALGTTTICSDSLNSAGGTLSCTVPSSFKNSTVSIKIISGGEEKRFAILKLDTDPSEIYGNNLMFLGLMIIILFIGIGVTDSPPMMGFMLILGVVLLTMMNIVSSTGWIGVGATILWFVIAIILVLIKGGNRQ